MYSRNYIFLLLLLPYLSISQNFWKKADESKFELNNSRNREIIPEKYFAVSLNNFGLEKELAAAPSEFPGKSGRSEFTVELPMPDGTFEEFIVWQAPVMEEKLAARYPSIKSYKAFQKNNKKVTARFSTGPNGFHGSIRTDEGMVYVDPYSVGELNHYMVYYTADHRDERLNQKNLCGTDESLLSHTSNSDKWGTRSTGGKMELRKYRLALACTGEWGAIRGTKEKALADMVIFIERALIVFEGEIALTVELIAKNDDLIFLDGFTDPYTNSNMGQSLVGQNTTVLNVRIGSGSYDIGHVFSICSDVGGVVGGEICTSSKGAGVTCYNSLSVSNREVSTFTHEVAHQMTALHTFNSCELPPAFANQLHLGTAFEPGSGSTILSYANACGSENLGVPRDPYYHVASLEQILNFTNSPGSAGYDCAQKIDINNNIPVINLGYSNGFSIPKGTPFFLEASAEDQDGDNMTYNWEQYDNKTSPLGFPMGNAPIFRSLKPAPNPARYFPNVSRILNRQFTEKTEILPTYGRDLTFRFVVRDNNPQGNAAVWEEMKFKVADNAGPFTLTYPVQSTKMVVGKAVNVTWDVANTNIAPVNCKFVDIYIMYNNDLNFGSENMLIIAKSVPNDGEENIIVPNRPGLNVRVVVKATDNIFFTTGLFDSRIDAATTPSFITDVIEANKKVCLPGNVSYDFTTTGLLGLDKKIKFEIVSGLPENATAAFDNNEVNPGENITLNIDANNVTGTSDYEIFVRSYVEGVDTIVRVVRLGVTGTDLDFVGLNEPENGLNGVGPVQKYTWDILPDAESYQLEVATSPSFLPEEMVIKKNTELNNYNSVLFLEKATIYFWRVRAFNSCRNGLWSDINAFSTESLNCTVAKSGELSINISQSGTPKVEALLNVFSDGKISDLNVKNIKGDHQWSGDIVAFLTSPSGKEVLLWSRKCGSSKGFNLGIDDQSLDFFQCPINTGRIYRPESPLAAFNGENMKGNWTLRLEDKASGNGGRLQNFDLELCANVVLNPPFLTRNEVLKIHPKDTRIIDRIMLLSEDMNNTATEIKYILVSVPNHGLLTWNGNPMEAGSLFTQEDIDNQKIKYLHTSDNENDDKFSFIVSDGQGGWIGITNFKIEVDSDFPSDVINQSINERILLYPNPAHDILNILMIDREEGNFKVTITDVTGRTIRSFPFSSSSGFVEIQDLQSGVYVLRIDINDAFLYKKFVKK